MSAAAERMRRHRLRRRLGVRPVVVEIEEETLDQLRERGVLTDDDLNDQAAMAETLGYYFSDLVRLRRNGDP